MEERKLESNHKPKSENAKTDLKAALAPVTSDVGNLVSMQQRRLREVTNDHTFGRDLMKKMEWGEKFKPRKLLGEVSARILQMKNDERSDYDINQMITDVKSSFNGKNYAKTMNSLPLFNGGTSRNFKSAPSRRLATSNSAKRILAGPGNQPSTAYMKQQALLVKLGTPPPRYLVPIKNPNTKANVGFVHKQFKEMSPRELREIDSWDGDYSPGRSLRQTGSARRLAKKKDKKASKIKNEFKTRIEMVVRDIKTQYNGGDIDGFEKSWPKENFTNKIIERISCVSLKKTNRLQNYDQIFYKQKEGNCVDMKDKKYDAMKKFIKKKVKYPGKPDWADKKFNVDDYLDENVLEFLDEVSNNLNNKAEFVEKELDEDGNEKKILRGRRLELEDEELKPEALGLEDEKVSVDERSAATADEGVTLDTPNKAEQTEAQKIKLLEHTMSQKLDKLFINKKVHTDEESRDHESWRFVLDDRLKYDMLNGIGKTGYAKIDFEEAKVLRGMDAFARLDQSIVQHAAWNGNFKAAGILKVWGGLVVAALGALLVM